MVSAFFFFFILGVWADGDAGALRWSTWVLEGEQIGQIVGSDD